MAKGSMVSYMQIELGSSEYNRSLIEYLTPEHKRIYLQFIQAERNFLNQPEAYGVHCDNLVANLNALGQIQQREKWIETMVAWRDSVKENYNVIMMTPNSIANSVLSAEDEELIQHIHENKLWADPSIEQINCVIHYLETNQNADDLWSTISIELDNLSNTKRTETFWKQAFRRIVKRIKAKQVLIDATEDAGNNFHKNSLTKLEHRLLCAMTNAQFDGTGDFSLESSGKNASLKYLTTHCRICLSTSSKMMHLFSNSTKSNSQNTEISLLKKLNYCSCLSIESHENDGFPQYICMSCSVLLESTYQLKLLCSRTEKRLQELLLENGGDNVDISQQKELNENDESILTAELQKSDVQICTEENYELAEEYIIEFDDVSNRTEEGTCGKAFKTTSAIANHRAVHAETKDFKCSLCPFTTSTKANLKIHDRTHNGSKPYECPQPSCTFKFSTGSNMIKHMRNIHEKQKTNKCDQCNRVFFSRESLRKHSVRHSGLKPFFCPKCKMEYSWYNGLKNMFVNNMPMKTYKF